MGKDNYAKLIWLSLIFIVMVSVHCADAQETGSTFMMTTSYSSGDGSEYAITTEFSDEWLLRDPTVYNHKLAQASFGLAVSGYRDRLEPLTHKDENAETFLKEAGFTAYTSEDFHKEPAQNTVATAIAHKVVGNSILIACTVSGNVYESEWLNNLTIGDEERAEGFNQASQRVQMRIKKYIDDNKLSGDLRLWISGYSRAAAISNITAADLTDSGLFSAIYDYNIACPRTTKEKNPNRYKNIFNIINPFDPVPMAPFPEWGFSRYGTDMFLSSWETDSRYLEKKVKADKVFSEFKGEKLPYNPQVNAELHTFLDMLLFYINSTRSYQEIFQNGVLDLYATHNPDKLVNSILSRVEQLPEITAYQIKMFYNFLDYSLQVIYQDIICGKMLHKQDRLWNPSLSIQENIAHEHYDEVYRSWLFASDDPSDIYQNDPEYIHFTITGDTDIFIYDENDQFLQRVFSDGTISYDIKDALDEEDLGGTGRVFAERRGSQTITILPKDQNFTIITQANQNQIVKYSYVSYDCRKLNAEVKYVFEEPLEKGYTIWSNVDPEMLHEFSQDELQKIDIYIEEPWSDDIIYSAMAVMRMENQDVFHPTPFFFIAIPGLILILVLFLVILGLIRTGKGIHKSIKRLRKKINAKKTAEIFSDTLPNRDIIQNVPKMENKNHENQ